MYSVEDIENIFTYHKPTEDQLPKYKAVREAAMQFALILTQYTPVCADQSAAMRKLRECVHVANASIALNGKS